MKKILFLLLVLLGMTYMSSAQSAAAADKMIKMDKEKYELGKIPVNEPMTFYMEFTNISNKPIVVENVMAGCGCTVPEKPAAPVLPGKKGKIKVGYNAAGHGVFTKDVQIKIAGVNEPKIVLFTGETVEQKK